MATRRRIGVSAATTEAARRQLMQPVPCWEKVWVTSESAPSTTLKVFKWVKSEKLQQFSDDEGEVDEPLAPLPDEPEVVEGDEEMEQDENAIVVDPEPTPIDATSAVDLQAESTSKPSSPKPELSLQPTDSSLPVDDTTDTLDASLKPLDEAIEEVDDVEAKLDQTDGIVELDLTSLGPDGLGLESSHDLSQMEGDDVILGGPLMDESVDPFAPEPMAE